LETVAESHTDRLDPTIGQLTTSRLGAVLKVRELNVFLARIVVGALISLATSYFLTTNNLMGVFRSFSLTAIMSIGMVMGLAWLVTALCFGAGAPMAVCVLAGLVVGVVFGAFNGLLMTGIGLPPFIAALGSLSIGRGLTYIVTEGVPATPDTPDMFSLLGQGYNGPVPAPVVIMIVLTIGFSILVRRTRFGRHVYATPSKAHTRKAGGLGRIAGPPVLV
jgi:ribose transport system permease protein